LIISQTPLRISFVGGGTDLKNFWEIEEGKVLSAAIDKYIYVVIKKRFDNKIVINYTKREVVNRISDIQHELVREAMLKTSVLDGVEIWTPADIPSSGSGLGSSSTLTVGLLNAFYTFKGKQVTANRLAEEACDIEINILNKPIGKQDQYIAAYGGLREITFHTNGTVSVEKVAVDLDILRIFFSNILIFYTKVTRKSSTILEEQKRKTKEKIKTLRVIKNQVRKFRTIIESSGSLNNAGQILHETWMLKKKLASKISNDNIDQMYDCARKSGAIGGKISGAGGGGFLMLYVPIEKQDSVREELKEYQELPIMLDQYGSKIVLNIRRS